MHRYEVFQSKDGQWRWHALRGGRITADSGEGYTRRRDAVRAVRNEIKAAAKCAADPDRHIVTLDLRY
jgi:uncharacterized protein YegP (UPF0339 family)